MPETQECCEKHGKPAIYDCGTVVGIPMGCDECLREYIDAHPLMRLPLRTNSIITTDGN